MRRARSRALALVSLAILPLPSGCTVGQLRGRSPSYVVIDALEATSGARPSEFGGTLASDVVTRVTKTVGGNPVVVATVFEDTGRVTMHMALTDPGTTATPAAPSTANAITLTRYHVSYVRADGRNVPGVDVPFGFDEAVTTSLSGSTATAMTFVLVRAQAKDEAPLKTLIDGGGAIVISTIAHVTFYGTDQAGRAVTATGDISVHFSDWADPD